MIIKNGLTIDKLTLSVLLASSLFFGFKGVRYALISSYVPLIFVVAVLGLFMYSTTLNPKWFKRAINYWGILLILWSLGRFAVEVLFYFTDLTESHIWDQFTLVQNLLSTLFLFFGLYLVKYQRQLEVV